MGSEPDRAQQKTTARSPFASRLLLESLEPRVLFSGDSVVTFNELHYNPAAGDAGGEWVEIHNQLSLDVDLSGWRLSGAVDFTFAPGTTIAAGDYLVVAADPAALEAAEGITGVIGGWDGSLSNGGETIRLRDRNDRVMDILSYNDAGDFPVAPDGSGATLAKTDEHLPTEEPASWSFSQTLGGTPGGANVAANSALRLSEVAGALDAVFQVELENTGGSTINLSGYTLVLNGAADVIYALSGTIGAGGFVSFTQAQTGMDPADEDRLYLLGPGQTIADAARVENIARARSDQWDGRWQRPGVATFGGANSFNFEDAIVINEVLYNQVAVDPVDPAITTQQLVQFDSVWRYNQNGVDQGQGWAATSHTAGVGGWQSGAGVLGFESATLAHPINTGLSLGPRTYYFETDFTFTGDPASITQLRLEHLVDDGAVFYLNGVEVGTRINLPGGTINASTLANPGVDNTSIGAMTLDASYLVVGTNRLSVEVHQTTDTSSDIVMGAALQAIAVTDPGVPYSDDPEEWIELYNNSGSTIDLSGWKFDDGVDFEFAPGTSLGAGEYLVVARNAAALAAKYPGIAIAGQYDGRLSNAGERIQLVDAVGNLADEVTYYEGGAWDNRADGGGSSLELRDPDADNANGQAWAASEAPDPGWQTVSYTGVATTPGLGSNIWNEFIFGLLDDGEVLIDDISVIRDPGGANQQLIQNGSFNSLSNWRAGGNHRDVQIIADPDNAANNVLYLNATGPAEHLFNHVETTLAGNTAIVPGQTYEISYKAKWLSGSNQLNTRLYFNYLPNTEYLTRPNTTGTPGMVNSTAEANIGPTYANLAQSVVTPGSFQPVTISVDAVDPDGVASVRLWYRRNEGAWQSTLMINTAGDRFEGTIPGYASGSIVQFYVEGTDGNGAGSTFPADGRDSRALYKVNTSANTSSNSIQIVMLQSDSNEVLRDTNRMNNGVYGATVVDETGKIYYDVGARLKGSPSGRLHNSHKGFHVRFDADNKYRGVHDSIALNRNSLWQEQLGHHLLTQAAGGVIGVHNDAVNFVSPTGAFSGKALLLLARHTDTFLDSQYDNGGDGSLFTVELSYAPTTTQSGQPDGLKEFFPWTHSNGMPDFIDYGADPEVYRYHFQLDNARGADDYSGLLDLASVFSLSGDALYQRALEVLDIDQWVRTFAAQSLIGNDDTVGQLYPHNIKVYDNPETGLINALFWDLDRSFRVSLTAPLWGSGGSTDRLFEIPQVSRLFYGHVDDLIQNSFNGTYLNAWSSHYAGILGTSNPGPFPGPIQSPPSYVQNRGNYIQNNLLPSLAPFNITTNGGGTINVPGSQVTLEGTGSYKIRELYADGLDDPLSVTWLDDTSWRVTLNLNPGVNPITLRAFDYAGSEISSDTILVVSTDDSALARDFLRITEINYHPADPTPAELLQDPGLDDNDFEFIELLNTSATQPINLQGIHFIEQVLNDDNQGITYTFGDVTLGAGERVVLADDPSAFAIRYGGVAIAGNYSGNLDNSGETITLRDATGQTIQQFAYDDNGAAGWPTSPDGGGATLVTVNTAGGYNDPANWVASSTPNGTPGADEAPALPADLDGDGDVDDADYGVLFAAFSGPGVPTANAAADLDGDGDVDDADFGLAFAAFTGPGAQAAAASPPPPATRQALVSESDDGVAALTEPAEPMPRLDVIALASLAHQDTLSRMNRASASDDAADDDKVGGASLGTAVGTTSDGGLLQKAWAQSTGLLTPGSSTVS